ncbi:zinc finger protein 135-like [Athalia rosae]|uniref:zinc finger protein 135-like n=1 Tax=Athalia rosae TaxID=37344 RepID=UPI0020339579|nr:zinc finger protein 135-like [Athalia rosae]XP_048510884.1 zinc finger protein 135-like [Athalia rosae]
MKQEMDFLDVNMCSEPTIMQINSNKPSMEQGTNENGRSVLSRGEQNALTNLDCDTTRQSLESNLYQKLEKERPTTEHMNSRCQVDIIDMRSDQHADYRFILAFEDQESKFVILRPLKSNDAKDVAVELFDILAIIGAPRVLQSGNGRQFASKIVYALRSLWTDLPMVHGDLVLPSTSVKRDFTTLLKNWLHDNPAKTWCEGLRFVQIIENTTFKQESGRTAHELLFVNNVLDDSKTAITKEDMKMIWSEEDLQEALNHQQESIQSTNHTSSSKLIVNNYGEQILPNNPVSYTEENLPMKEDTTDPDSTEFERQTRQSTTHCNNSSGFKFVNVKNESPLNVSLADDSQSDDEVTVTSQGKTRSRNKYQLKCKICQKRYMKLGHLKNHLKAHTKANKFECTICSKKFRLVTVYEKHMRQFHSSEKTSFDARYARIGEGLESDTEETLKSKRLKKVEPENDESSQIHRKKVTKKVGRQSSQLGGKKLSRENRATRVNGSPPLECSYCQQKFDFPSVLKRHVRSHTNERPYVCQICNKSFKQLGHLSQHSLTHTDYRSFQCAKCGIKFESLDSLKIHSQSHRGDTVMYRPKEVYRLFECDNCKKVFTTKSVLERHIFTHTHERQFGCKVCGKRFKQAGHVKSHMLVHTGERKFECKVCSKRFSLSNSLKKHMYIHNGEKPYQCDVCGARFLEKRNLNGHLMTHTNERPFSCNICGKRYTLADTLRRHVSAAHEDGRTYQCEICAKMFKQLAHLYVHKKVHTDERPYQCHLCDKNFKHKNVLKSHLAIHANLRPFECDVCKATFVRKTNLQTHIASAHMNERPYVCTICNKRFKQVSHLNGHVVVHSNSMPYQCDFCDRRCNRLDNLKKHMRLHTKTKE